MVVDPIACKAGELFVLRTQFFKEFAHLHLTHLRGQLVVALETNGIRDLGIEVVEGPYPDFLHHRLQIVFRLRKVFVIHKNPIFGNGLQD